MTTANDTHDRDNGRQAIADAHTTWAARLERTPSYIAGQLYDLLATTRQPLHTINTDIYVPMLKWLRDQVAGLDPAETQELVDDLLALAEFKLLAAELTATSEPTGADKPAHTPICPHDSHGDTNTLRENGYLYGSSLVASLLTAIERDATHAEDYRNTAHQAYLNNREGCASDLRTFFAALDEVATSLISRLIEGDNPWDNWSLLD